MDFLYLILGLIILVVGAEVVIRGSVSFGKKLNISLFAIGVVIVAGGTSLPELATGVVAALRKESNLAVGTILGSNIYNIVGIFALIIFIQPLSITYSSTILLNNIIIMTVITFLFVYKVRFGLKLINILPFHLGRKSGFLFLILYLIYIFYNYKIIN